MAQTRDTKTSTAPNIQDVFLNFARRERLPVIIRMMDGENIEAASRTSIASPSSSIRTGADRMVFKHAIATIRSPRSSATTTPRTIRTDAGARRGPLFAHSLNRVILIVLDSVGIGELPDAAAYGDAGSDTLGNLSAHVHLHIPTLRSLGLTRVVTLTGRKTSRRPRPRSDGWREHRPARTR